MEIAQKILVSLVGLLHVYFFYLERFLWRTLKGQKLFAMSEEKAKAGEVLAANQGVYNLLLAFGLFYCVYHGSASLELQIFILGFIVLVGIYGAITASLSILFLQVIPAGLALAVTLLT